MKPLLLSGHVRSVQKVKFNREGDLLISTAKDKEPSIWWTINGERLGTLVGHQGVVWCADFDWKTQNIVTGSGDFSARIWDCSTGKETLKWAYPSTVKHCSFSYSGNIVCLTTSKQAGSKPCLRLHDLREPNSYAQVGDFNKGIMDYEIDQTLWASALCGNDDQTIYLGTSEGVLHLFDMRMEKVTNSVKEHTRQIMDIQTNSESSLILTASQDNSAKLFQANTLDHLKTYQTDRPVNSAAISPIRKHVLLGGGQEAMSVTTTAVESGKFESRFFHLIFEEEFARVHGHFGPLNSVAFQPDGKGYVSGSEDGYLRLHQFDQDYFDYTIEGDEDNQIGPDE